MSLWEGAVLCQSVRLLYNFFLRLLCIDGSLACLSFSFQLWIKFKIELDRAMVRLRLGLKYFLFPSFATTNVKSSILTHLCLMFAGADPGFGQGGGPRF